MLKYWLEYNDTENILHRLEINKATPNLIVNGDFLTSDSWTLGATWTIDIGNNWAKNTGNGTPANITQEIALYKSGVTYEVSYTIVTGGVGSINFAFEGATGTLQQGAFKSSVGIHTAQITLTEDKPIFRIQGDYDIEDVYVTNISVTEVVTTTEVNGHVNLDYSSTEKSLEPIRGQGLSVSLEANTDLTFSDLFSEFERTFKVTYYRDSVILFVGWLNIEGLYQDYVHDRWVITLDCIDGLGYLKDLSYVDLNGLPYLGKQTQLEIIQRCLLRTELELNINTNIDIFYTGLSETLNVLDNVYLNGQRFRRDIDTIMSCEQVLRDTLQPYGAVITSHNGEWYIYKPNQLYSDNTPTFYRYDYLGVALSPTTKTEDFSKVLGSQINGFYPHHASGNQSMKLEASLGALRIYYKFGVKKSILDNTFLENLDGINIADWVVESLSNMSLPQPNGFGVDFTATDANYVLNLSTAPITVPEGFQTQVTFDIDHDSDLEDGKFWFQYAFQETASPQKTWYLDSNVSWSLESNDINYFSLPQGATSFTYGLNVPNVPKDGDLTLRIYTPTVLNLDGGNGVSIKEITINPSSSTSVGNLVGQKFTFQRINRPTSKTADTVDVYNADNPSEVYIGTIYKADKITPTETWFRKGYTEDLPIIVIMGDETMRINQKNAILFSGDIYGYIPYLSVISIENISGLFMFIEYSYDTKANITSMVLRQIHEGELGASELYVDIGDDYGTTVKPTIRG